MSLRHFGVVPKCLRSELSGNRQLSQQHTGQVVTSLRIYCYFKAGGSSALLMDLAANEKSVHADFLNGNS